MDWLVGLVNPKDWLIPKIDCDIYSVYVLEEKHFYMHFDMYFVFHLRVI